MAKQRHLRNAPVTEALIDFRLNKQEALTFADLQTAFGSPDFGYYVKNAISEGTLAFKLAPTGHSETETESAQVGLRLHSTDEKYVAQFALHGFTLSRLSPYENWENLLAETRRLWLIYHQRLAPSSITRIATRYINNLKLPLKAGMAFDTYLHNFVDIPDEVPQTVEGFFQRFLLVDQPTGARLALTLVLQTSLQGDSLPIILDLDASLVSALDPKDNSLWTNLEDLHDLKNRGFFGTITEQAAELYE